MPMASLLDRLEAEIVRIIWAGGPLVNQAVRRVLDGLLAEYSERVVACVQAAGYTVNG
jgi:hypothetical protein